MPHNMDQFPSSPGCGSEETNSVGEGANLQLWSTGELCRDCEAFSSSSVWDLGLKGLKGFEGSDLLNRQSKPSEVKLL